MLRRKILNKVQLQLQKSLNFLIQMRLARLGLADTNQERLLLFLTRVVWLCW